MIGPILVTGASGFIGSHLARSCVDLGHRVVVIERDATKLSGLDIQGVRGKSDIVHGDVTDQALLTRTLVEYDIRTVYHLAAQALVGVANRSAASTMDTNVRGTWALLEACRAMDRRIRAIVVASSDKAYGDQEQLPYCEDMSPLDAVYPYDVSKACADLIARSYARTYRLPVVVTRCANVYGPGDPNLSRLVPEVALAAARGVAPVIRSDGSPERDYLYIDDCLRAYHLLADSATKEGVRGEAFNVGTGVPISVMKLVVTALEAGGRPEIEPVIKGQATNEIDRQYLDCAKIQARLGYTPEWALEEGLRATVRWYADHLDLFVPRGPNGEPSGEADEEGSE
ncbi:MAG: NAD-dependent epimerase/dehydratase family protein [Armatimonadia bacterium]|nr:NAD-dependent epimerase/dehydratase family protein [Armatimonadia bacterium]